MIDWKTDPRVACSFCGSARGDGAEILLGPSDGDTKHTNICDGCVVIAVESIFGSLSARDPNRAADFASDVVRAARR